MIRQYGRESVADFLFKFWEVCLKINDLPEAEKLDRFLHALVPNVRVKVELRGPAHFQEAVVYAEWVDVCSALLYVHEFFWMFACGIYLLAHQEYALETQPRQGRPNR